MTQGIEILDVIEVRKEYRTEGHKPLLVLAEDFELYVAKSSKAQIPPVSVTNELICSMFLNCWGLKTPASRILRINPEIIDISLSPTNKTSFYQELCFGSKLIPEAFEIQAFSSAKTQRQFVKLKQPMDLLWIGLFDMWVENEDRKPSNPNLLLVECNTTHRFEIYAIDHAYTFLSMRYDDLDPSWGVSQSYNDSILEATLVRDILPRLSKQQGPPQKVDFLSKIEFCQRNFSSFVRQLPDSLGMTPELTDCVAQFLFESKRNELVFEEFLARLH
jgi:hypothetical protein